MPANTSAIRAGRAYVELGVDDRTAQGLAGAEARLRRYQQNAEQLQRRYAKKAQAAAELSKGEVPGAKTLRQAMEARYAARGQAASMLRELQGQSERAGTMAQQIAGRSALASRLAAFKAQYQVKSAWNDYARLAEANHRGIAAGGIGAMDDADSAAMNPWLRALLGRKAAKYGKLIGSAAVPLGVAALGMKAVAAGAEAYNAVSDASSNNPEKAAQSAEKIRDTLSDIPIIGSYIGLLTESWHQKNQKVIQDFEEIRAKGQKVSEALAGLVLERKMSGKDTYERRQIEIQDQWRKREDEAAQLEVQARGYAGDSPEAVAAMVKARAMRQENDAWKERELGKAARERDMRLAAQDDDVQLAAIAGMGQGLYRQRREMGIRHARELREAQSPGSDVDVGKLLQRQRIERTNLETDADRERVQERRRTAEALTEVDLEGYAKERELLRIRHQAQIEEYQSAGRDTTELRKRQAAELQGLARREAQDTLKITGDLRKQIGLAQDPAAAKDWAWFDFSQTLAQLGKTKDQIESIRGLWEKAWDAGKARAFGDAIKSIDDSIAVKRGTMTGAAARFREWFRRNPEATAEQRQQMGTRIFQEAAADELEKLKTPREKLAEYQRQLQEMVEAGSLTRDQANRLLAKADVRNIAAAGTFNVAEARGLGAGGGPMERTASAVEKIVENTKALRNVEALVVK